MFKRSFMVACLIAAAASCDRQAAPQAEDRNTISAVPEHFDRARTEQDEKEEDRLRQRARRD